MSEAEELDDARRTLFVSVNNDRDDDGSTGAGAGMELDGEAEEEEDCGPLKRERAIKDLFKKWKLLEKVSECMKAAGPKSASAPEVLGELPMLQRLQALECRYVGRKPTCHSQVRQLPEDGPQCLA